MFKEVYDDADLVLKNDFQHVACSAALKEFARRALAVVNTQLINISTELDDHDFKKVYVGLQARQFQLVEFIELLDQAVEDFKTATGYQANQQNEAING